MTGTTNIKKKLNTFFSQEFFHSGMVQWAIIGAAILNLADWGILGYFIRPVDFPIILHYNVYFGVDLIGDWWQSYSLPLVGMLTLLTNASMGFIFYCQKERVIAHVLLLAAVFVQIIVTIGLIGLIRINY